MINWKFAAIGSYADYKRQLVWEYYYQFFVVFLRLSNRKTANKSTFHISSESKLFNFDDIFFKFVYARCK